MIWLIGGTSDSLKIANYLLMLGKEFLITTTTSYGASLVPPKGIEVLQKQLSYTDMISLVQERNIGTVIDASHPYAVEVSKNAIQASKECQINYYRFERKTTTLNGVKYYKTYEDICTKLKETEGNVLLTIGSKNLHHFTGVEDRVIARVLPVIDSIEACIKAGIPPHHIIAIKGILSASFNSMIFKEYNIQHLVTKDTGESGGFLNKVNPALKAGVEVHVLQKPELNYPYCFDNVEQIKSLVD